jgi:hypothetical protein
MACHGMAAYLMVRSFGDIDSLRVIYGTHPNGQFDELNAKLS